MEDLVLSILLSYSAGSNSEFCWGGGGGGGGEAMLQRLLVVHHHQTTYTTLLKIDSAQQVFQPASTRKTFL